MLSLTLSRLLQTAVTLFIGSIVVFASAYATGNPVQNLASPDATPEQVAKLAQELGLDRPLMEQYFAWLSRVLHGQLGTSIHQRAPVWDLISPRLSSSLQLAAVAMAMATFVGIPLGVIASVNRGKVWDKLAMLVAVLGQSMPSWWTGIVLMLVFGVYLRLLPVYGTGSWKHYILPAVSLGWFASAGVVRLVRSSMLETLEAEFVKLARAKGLSERVVIWKHALRNALIPAVTFVGLMFGILVGAAITVEVVFGWPGIGTLTYEGLTKRDFPLVQGVVLIWLVLVILVSFGVDLIYGVLDPRTRR